MANRQPHTSATTPRSWAEFLESTPPGVTALVQHGPELDLESPHLWRIPGQDIRLYCGTAKCDGMRSFAVGDAPVGVDKPINVFVTVFCRNCRETYKTFAVEIDWDRAKDALYATKYGELPEFGPPVPARVISLIGPNRELFLRGRRAENHGLGIGAFAYYRRVVENQKSRLITEIGKVAVRLKAEPHIVASFERAAKETQFTRAIEEIKDSIPSVLLIEQCNPLALLHSALSEGLHELSEEECLALAQHIRVVLTELAERISSALKDEAELTAAVKRLREKRGAAPGTGESSME